MTARSYDSAEVIIEENPVSRNLGRKDKKINDNFIRRETEQEAAR